MLAMANSPSYNPEQLRRYGKRHHA
ncbi:hypothetical protein LNQ03_12260 [Klebsiella pneumoniae subsp. pneumoniae]|nr:hypothetical protein [Klebsiella pneumoniae subsp. pneumoniae]